MKKLFLSTVLIITTAFAQDAELSDAFLESLPEGFANQFGESDENINRYQPIDTSVEKINENIFRIKRDLSVLENTLLKELDLNRDSNELIIFGSNLFSSTQSSFMPINDPSLVGSYTVGPGDEITVQNTASLSLKNAKGFTVQRDGSLTLPEVGKINLIGKSLDQAEQIILSKFQNLYFGSETFVSLTNMKDISIVILGHVESPGSYTLNANSNIFHALFVAGGITEKGSYRNINLKRNNELIATLDLYDFLVNGNFIFDSKLQNGDVLMVAGSLKKISISGGVSTEAIFEIKDNESLSDLLEFSGGLTPSASKDSNLTINKISKPISFPISKIDEFDVSLENGDSIFVPFTERANKRTASVIIKGAVKNPGKYFIEPGKETLRSFIEKVGGYEEYGYPFGGQLFRESAKIVEMNMNTKAYKDLINSLLDPSLVRQGGIELQGLNLFLDQIKNAIPSGRVQVPFDVMLSEGDISKDPYLFDGDVINIPEFTDDIYIFGEVVNPGVRKFNSSVSSPDDYLSFAGGLTEFADKNRIILIHPDGNTFLMQKGAFSWLSANNLNLYPGSTIYVPKDLGKIDGLLYASTVAPIFSNLALSIASLQAIND